MKSKQQYVTELKDLMVDLEEAVDNADSSKIDEILDESSVIMNDIRSADF